MDRSTTPGGLNVDAPSASTAAVESRTQAPRRRKNHRGGKKKKKTRKQSFAAHTDDLTQDEGPESALNAARESFYNLNRGGNISGTSLDSEALLDHREQPAFFRPRRPSVMGSQSQFQQPLSASRLRTVQSGSSIGEDDEAGLGDEDMPLLSNSARRSDTVLATSGGYGSNDRRPSNPQSRRGSSRASSKRKLFTTFPTVSDSYNVNYPPSVPGSPQMRPNDRNMRFEDMMLRDGLSIREPSPTHSDIAVEDSSRPGTGSRSQTAPLERRHTIALQAEEDVCFPQEGMSELADDELVPVRDEVYSARSRRRRNKWPDLSMLEEWSRIEKEGRSDERRAKKITEPQLINGRLRPIHKGWFRTEEDAPYRFTYFNEEFQSTIHSQTISELVQPGGSFRELFVPDPPLLEDSSDEDDDDEDERRPSDPPVYHTVSHHSGDSRAPTRKPSLMSTRAHGGPNMEGVTSPLTKEGSGNSQQQSGRATPGDLKSSQGAVSPGEGDPPKPPKPPRYGDRPVWWLDVLSPTEAEMRVLSKTFGIHPLTAEDIMLQEAREKVELFRHYYFVNYRTFDQDQNSENFLEPVNMYVVVFREGVLSFHFSMTPHAANVRRRIRQLSDYLILSSDWISYAIIDDITDVFVPLIQSIEEEVDEIDDAILRLHSPGEVEKDRRDNEKRSEDGTVAGSGGDMLRWVGDCRKKVMSLYRLLGNKADVIKGFAKRCNEQWEVAPRSEIGLYLGDIQDHIVTMTSNLSHYEKMLSRSHANYLAQINIRMNERAEQTNDVLGKLTVLGTIVLPMNIITGLWGMNVWVPGQDYEGDLTWFFWISAGLLFFGLACFLIAKRVYNIV
ncbi:CorA family metal ion transporter [Pleurostoma richardsiae]|uniref:CorA family metal ion transporter n=1 Tax=Pleurostoma richardsiae TaxID=41990 RepID=A0AA38S817_9PEZI|nr:CorA family metal ion transporter [Pleurostoma richardsiae]